MTRMGYQCSRVPPASGAGRGPRGGEGGRGPEHLSSEGGATVELRLAGRMGLLGTETAFEVLARAKALEREGGGGGPPPPPQKKSQSCSSPCSRWWSRATR